MKIETDKNTSARTNPPNSASGGHADPNLLAICTRHRLAPTGDPQNPSLPAVIYALQQKLEQHGRHLSATANPWTGDHAVWKQTQHALQDQLQELQAFLPQPGNSSIASHPSYPSHSTHPPSLLPPPSPEPPASHTKNQPHNRVVPGSVLPSQPLPSGSPGGSNPGRPESGPGRSTSDSLPKQPKPAPSRATSPADPADSAASDEPNLPLNLDPDLCAAALELLASKSTNSPLDDLPAHQRANIYQLLQDHSASEVASLLAQSPPLGLSLKTCKSSMNRFRKRYERELQQKDGLENIEAIEKTFSGSDDPASLELNMQTLIQRLLTGRLLKRAASARSTPQELNILIRALNNLRRQHLLEKKIHLELLDKLNASQSNPDSTNPKPSASNHEETPSI